MGRLWAIKTGAQGIKLWFFHLIVVGPLPSLSISVLFWTHEIILISQMIIFWLSPCKDVWTKFQKEDYFQ